jgi:hypothetical protein
MREADLRIFQHTKIGLLRTLGVVGVCRNSYPLIGQGTGTKSESGPGSLVSILNNANYCLERFSM